jgi:hypothetical protein
MTNRVVLQQGGGKDRKGGFSMEKSKILLVGLIGILMAGGLVLAGCVNPCEIKKGDCNISVSVNINTAEVALTDIAICSNDGCRVVKTMKGIVKGTSLEFNPKCDCK